MTAIIKNQRVALRAVQPGELATVPRTCANDEGRAEKRVRLLRDRGRVYALELSCACGERTVVELEYEVEGEPEPEAPREDT